MPISQKEHLRSQVIKIDDFRGSLPDRPLYVYLPPQYEAEPEREFPLLLLQDGQNCFDAFASDSYTGTTWAADKTADRLIQKGQIAPFIMAAVGHGGRQRIIEYLPPYSTFEERVLLPATGGRKRIKHIWVQGEAQKTASYYRHELLPYLKANYRIKTDRQHVAICGSSMGGLFALYLAIDHPDLTRHCAALSASFWITARADNRLEIAERIRQTRPNDVRIWLDSGTEDRPGEGDDNSPGVIEVRDALLAAGFKLGPNFRYLLDDGAIHSESAWAKRLPKIFTFLLAEWKSPA